MPNALCLLQSGRVTFGLTGYPNVVRVYIYMFILNPNTAIRSHYNHVCLSHIVRESCPPISAYELASHLELVKESARQHARNIGLCMCAAALLCCTDLFSFAAWQMSIVTAAVWQVDSWADRLPQCGQVFHNQCFVWVQKDCSGSNTWQDKAFPDPEHNREAYTMRLSWPGPAQIRTVQV